MRLTRLTLLLIAGILALGFYRLCDYLLDDLEFQTFQATEESMVDAAHLFAAAAEAHLVEGRLGSETLEAFERTFSNAGEREFEAQIFVKKKTGVSLDCYLTDQDGIVIFDSRHERTGQDLSVFNDVYQTKLGEYGARSSRIDEGDASTSVMYVGAPIRHDGEIVGVATAYKAQKELLPFVYKRRGQILRPAIAIALAILFLIWSVLFWLYRPIGRLAEYARRITAGERPAYPSLGKGQEVNALGKALRDMRETLEGRSYVENYTQTLTHELKSPLAAIRGSAELLDEEMPLAARHRFLKNIRTEVDRSERLINRLLHLSALEGKTELQKREPIVVNTLMEDSVRLLKTQADLRNVTVRVEHPPQPVIFSGDFYIIRAALENLLQNAIDFSPEGSVITVTLALDEEMLTLTVKDEGLGLPEYAIERAFDRFYSHRPEDCASKGSGLGLTFVREAAQLHGGSARIANHPEGGAVATIQIPL
ncbi:two-component system sensor histidine kinase CreC [Roseibacillus persicicus]|uniref:two-component system sensor histidine kinase CreC n=1 Tax=Roseibacillus persicicus TaxID=454148 RepID=UPI00280D641A|nr:two-component system sensor histidine kinase CreC [Roseibacillus persicicus]MDQ8191929.1 two-component system sensor histidine kinase CreC [Roseibacillus persicicus]